MTAIAKITNKGSGGLFRKKKSVDSVIQSLEVINSLETELKKSLGGHESAEATSSSLATSWNERASRAKEMIPLAETEEGRQAMEVLEAKASRFADFYRQIHDRDKAKTDEVKASLQKIRVAQKQLQAVEKTQALDATLSRMAAEENIVIDDSPSLDHREISRVIHSAQALVEIKTGRL